MKRNTIRIALLCCLLLGVFAMGTAAFADNGQQQLPGPGILPDSPFYFLNQWGKDISMFFTFGNQAKAEKALKYAGQSLAAARAMEAKGKDNLVAASAHDYQEYMKQVQDRLQSISDNGTSGNLSEKVALATGFHLTVLDGLSANLTGEAADAIEHALQVSVRGQEQALKVLARHHAERALKIASDNINAHLQALHDWTDNVTGFSGNLTGGLDITGNLTELENQLSAVAEQQGIDPTTIQQWLSQATSQRLDTLSKVYDRVPEQAREAIQHAAQNSFKLFQRAIDRLSSANISGNFTGFSGNFSGNETEAESLLHKLGASIREHLGLNGTDNTTDLSDNSTFGHIEREFGFSANVTGLHQAEGEHQDGASDNGSNGHSVGTHNP